MLKNNDKTQALTLLHDNPELAARSNAAKIASVLADALKTGINDATTAFIEKTNWSISDLRFGWGWGNKSLPSGDEQVFRDNGLPSFPLSKFDRDRDDMAEKIDALYEMETFAKRGDILGLKSVISQHPALLSSEFANDGEFGLENMKWKVRSEYRTDKNGYGVIPGMDNILNIAVRHGQLSFAHEMVQMGFPFWLSNLNLNGCSLENKQDFLNDLLKARKDEMFQDEEIRELMAQNNIPHTEADIGLDDSGYLAAIGEAVDADEQPSKDKILRNLAGKIHHRSKTPTLGKK